MNTQETSHKMSKTGKAALAGIGFVAVLIATCAIFLSQKEEPTNFFLTVFASPDETAQAWLETGNGTTALAGIHTFEGAAPAGAYKILTTVSGTGSDSRDVALTIDPAGRQILVRAGGFAGYEGWKITADKSTMAGPTAFDWSGKTEIALPLYTRPSYNLCFEGIGDKDVKICHTITQRISS